MVCVSLAAGVLALLNGGRQDRSIAADSTLKAPVTLSIANRPVSEVLKVIATKTKSPLTVLKSVADARVTVYVEDEPAWIVLDKIADVLMGEWNPADPGGFRLSVPNETTSYRRTYIEREAKIAREPIELLIAELAKSADTPFPLLDVRRRALEAELATAKSSSRKKEIQEQLDALALKLDPTRYSLGMLFRTIRPASLEAFWQGKTLYAQLPGTATRPNRRGRGRNGGGAQGDAQGGAQGDQADDAAQDTPQRAGPSAHLFVKFDPLTDTLKLSGKASVPTAKAKLQLDPASLSQQTFGRMIAGWPSIQPDESDRRTKESARVTLDNRSSGTLADALGLFHEQTHIPVVADGSRRLFTLDASGSTLASFATNFSRATGAYVKVAGRFLEVRHPKFWRMVDYEVPESKFDVIEEKAVKANLTLDDYATFLTGLTQKQILYVCSNVPQKFKFESDPLRSAWPAIVAYASLQGLSRESSFQDLGCMYPSMTPVQRGLFVDAVTECVFLGIDAGLASAVITAANDPVVLQTYSLHVLGFAGVDSTTGAEKIGIRFGVGPTSVLYSFAATTGR